MQNPERFQTFQTGMAGIDVAIPVTGHFDFSTLKNESPDTDNTTIELVDVGGGEGTVLNKILEAHPELSPRNCVLQERPEVIQLAKSKKTLPDDVQLVEHDFMTEQPVRGARAYYLHSIIQDWNDDVNTQILKAIVPAMTKGYSKVLVNDFVVPDQGAHWVQSKFSILNSGIV